MHGFISDPDDRKQKRVDFTSFSSLVMCQKKDLALVKGLSEAKVEKIVEAAMKLELCNSFISGGELINRRAKVVKITTGPFLS